MSQSLHNTYFYELWGRQIQGPPRAAHTLATPLLFGEAKSQSFLKKYCLGHEHTFLCKMQLGLTPYA